MIITIIFSYMHVHITSKVQQQKNYGILSKKTIGSVWRKSRNQICNECTLQWLKGDIPSQWNSPLNPLYVLGCHVTTHQHHPPMLNIRIAEPSLRWDQLTLSSYKNQLSLLMCFLKCCRGGSRRRRYRLSVESPRDIQQPGTGPRGEACIWKHDGWMYVWTFRQETQWDWTRVAEAKKKKGSV